MSREHISATNRFEIEVQGSNITVSLPSALRNANQPTFIAKLPIPPALVRARLKTSVMSVL
jgi:hypothetical protein